MCLFTSQSLPLICLLHCHFLYLTGCLTTFFTSNPIKDTKLSLLSVYEVSEFIKLNTIFLNICLLNILKDLNCLIRLCLELGFCNTNEKKMIITYFNIFLMYRVYIFSFLYMLCTLSFSLFFPLINQTIECNILHGFFYLL